MTLRVGLCAICLIVMATNVISQHASLYLSFLTTHCNGVSEWLRGKFVRSNTPFYPRNSIQFKETCFLVSFLSRELNPLIWSWIWTFGFNFVLLIRDTPARRTPYWLYFTTFPDTTFPGEKIRAAIRHKYFASESLRERDAVELVPFPKERFVLENRWNKVWLGALCLLKVLVVYRLAASRKTNISVWK